MIYGVRRFTPQVRVGGVVSSLGEFVLQYLEEHPYNLLIGFALLPMGFKFYDTHSTHKTQLLMQLEDNRHSEKMLELEIRKSKNEKGDKSC